MQRFASTAFVVLLVACSSAPTPGTSNTKTGAKTPPSDGDDGETTTPPASSDDSQCKSQSGDACINCCVHAHPSGNNVFLSAIIDCACGASGVCKTQCASTICADATAVADATCLACTDAAEANGGKCYTLITSACQADPDCGKLRLCVANCP